MAHGSAITKVKAHKIFMGGSLWEFYIEIFGNVIFKANGAPGRIRTNDLLITNQLLYQLS